MVAFNMTVRKNKLPGALFSSASKQSNPGARRKFLLFPLRFSDAGATKFPRPLLFTC